MENANSNVTDVNMDFDASQLASVSCVTNILNLLTVITINIIWSTMI